MTKDKLTVIEGGNDKTRYVASAKFGDCMVCGEYKDLRCGACFHCSDKVKGMKIKGGHKLWQADKPSNVWYVGD